jgi:transcriptional regulator GlxA family with amidase domain
MRLIDTTNPKAHRHSRSILSNPQTERAFIQATGFKNPFHFSRMITLHNGASPRTFRNQAWSVGKK